METAYSPQPAYPQPGQPAMVDLPGFDTLYHQYHQAVYANIWKMVKQDQAAEDILQEVFLAFWENRHKLDTGKVAGWLFVTSFNKAARHLKNKWKENAVTFEEAGAYEQLAQEEGPNEELFQFRVSMVEDAVNHLPARKKEVFRLCRYEGKSYDEVASILGISSTSVKDYLKQSTRFIKDYIFAHYTEAGLALTPLLLLYFA
jgi:RNA polymerase sigma factor (sigma-70 family)